MVLQDQPVFRPAYTYIAKKKYWRFRYKNFEAPLPGNPGDADFEAKYVELFALVVKPVTLPSKPLVGTFDDVMGRFFVDAEFRALAERTQEGYIFTGRQVSRYLGDCMMQLTTVEMLAAVRNDMKISYGERVRSFISRLYTFAGKREWIEHGLNPARVLGPLRRQPAGHPAWSPDEIVLMFEHATGAIRTLLIIALCTGQRPMDVERMQWSQVIGEFVRVRQHKTGEWVDIPIHPLLRAELDRLRAQGPVEGAIVRKRNGKPIGDKGFRYRMKMLVRSIPNMPWRTPHGSRYATAAFLRDAGCDIDEICSIIGHRTYIMAVKYFKRRKTAMDAMAKMVRYAVIPQMAVPTLSLPTLSRRDVPSCDVSGKHVLCCMSSSKATGSISLGLCAV